MFIKSNNQIYVSCDKKWFGWEENIDLPLKHKWSVPTSCHSCTFDSLSVPDLFDFIRCVAFIQGCA